MTTRPNGGLQAVDAPTLKGMLARPPGVSGLAPECAMRQRMANALNRTFSIVETLGGAVVAGEYSASNPLPNEGELAAQFGVSRSILREAVKMLTSKGLVASRPRHGTWVTSESEWNFLDPDVLKWLLGRAYSPALLIQFAELRLGIEPQAARLAAVRGAPEAKAAVQVAMSRMMAADIGEDDPLASDIAFHHAILLATRNRFYTEMTDFIDAALRFSIRRTNTYKGVAMASILEHRRVADAIVAGDGEVAFSAMRSLIANVIALIEASAGARAEMRAANGQA